MLAATVTATGSEMQVGIIALMAFGMIVLGLFSRALDSGRRKKAVRARSADAPALQAHGPRHTGSRRPKPVTSITDLDRLAQLDRLVAKGHITPEDYARTKAELRRQ